MRYYLERTVRSYQRQAGLTSVLGLKYPYWSSSSRGPFSAVTDEGVREDDELSHDCGDGDFRRFAGFSERGFSLGWQRENPVSFVVSECQSVV
jgi:hypothetical protein